VHPFHILMLSANVVGLALILWRGEWIDRAATLALMAVVVLTGVLQLLNVPGLMGWIAGLDVALFFTLWALAERGERWWIVALTALLRLGAAALGGGHRELGRLDPGQSLRLRRRLGGVVRPTLRAGAA
jgi:hypothetical protein